MNDLISEFSISLDSIDYRDLKKKRMSDLETDLMDYQVQFPHQARNSLIKHVFFFSLFIACFKYSFALLVILSLASLGPSIIQIMFLAFVLFGCYFLCRIFLTANPLFSNQPKYEIILFLVLGLLAFSFFFASFFQPIYAFPLISTSIVFACFSLAILENLRTFLELSHSVDMTKYLNTHIVKRDSISMYQSRPTPVSKEPKKRSRKNVQINSPSIKNQTSLKNSKKDNSEYTIDIEGDLPSEFDEFKFQFGLMTSQSEFLDDSVRQTKHSKSQTFSNLSKSHKKSVKKKEAQVMNVFVNGEIREMDPKDIVSQKHMSYSNITEFDKIDKTYSTLSGLNCAKDRVNFMKLEVAVYESENQTKCKIVLFSRSAYNLGLFAISCALFLLILVQVPIWIVSLMIVPCLLCILIFGINLINIKGKNSEICKSSVLIKRKNPGKNKN